MSINLLTVLEDVKLPSWFPGRWPDILLDLLYYDASGESVSPAEWCKAYAWFRRMGEGEIIVVRPGPTNADFVVCDVREFLDDKLAAVDTIVVPGCGSSRVGAIAFGRLVANALGRPVAAVVAGYGTADPIGEALSATTSEVVNTVVALLDKRAAQWVGLMPNTARSAVKGATYDLSYAVPEAATVHALLLHGHGRFTTLVGHSKGSLAIAWALHALEASLMDVTDASVLEGQFGLSPTPDLQRRAELGKPVIALGDGGPAGQVRRGLDVFTFGCVVSLPGQYGADAGPGGQNGVFHTYPSHQYVGDADFWLGLPNSHKWQLWKMLLDAKFIRRPEIVDRAIVMCSGTSPWPLVSHNLISRNPWHPGYLFHMPADKILRAYAEAKW